MTKALPVRSDALNRRLALAGLVCLICEVPSFAQVASVRCCLMERDLLRVGQCLSGPAVDELPDDCNAPGTCVLGFGPGTGPSIVAALCNEDAAVPSEEPRAICASWRDEHVFVTEECVAAHSTGVDLFTLLDYRGDGDLDLRDFALFQEGFGTFPKVIQAEARIISLECCYPDGYVRGIGPCLSGPGVSSAPRACESGAVCEVGFSEPVELGDYMYELCSPGPVTMPDPSESFCSGWAEVGSEPVQTCRAAYVQGASPFIVFDHDGDTDLDMFDFASFQISFTSAPGDE